MTVEEVPFLDVAAGYRELKPEIDEAIAAVLRRGTYILGPEVESFEREWAEHNDVRYCVSVGNGLDALAVGLKALGVGPGDEVVVPSHTFIATWLAVRMVGATVVPVEPTTQSFVIDAASVRTLITERTSAVLPVHLYGEPVDAVEIDALCRRTGLAAIYDSAQAHGAKLDQRQVSRFGALNAWSFYPGKNLGAFGDGGAVTTDDSNLADIVRKLRNYGSERKYEHLLSGVNSRLDEIQAAILRVKLRVLMDWNLRRRAVADRYLHNISCESITLPEQRSGSQHAWHLFVIRTNERDRFRRHLNGLGIQTGIHYPVPPHRQPAFGDIPSVSLPVADTLSTEVLSLPIGPHMTDTHVDRVIEAVNSFPI